MVGNAHLTACAPVVIVGGKRHVQRLVVLVSIAQAASATRLTAAVVIGNDVIAAVSRVVAGADPGDCRRLRPRRAAVGGAAAAAAQEAVDRAVAPVLPRPGATQGTRPVRGRRGRAA